MPFTLTMPKLSPTMEEGTIVKWHKKAGDHVKEGDLIMEVATDKATVEFNALEEGWFRQILVKEGKDARVNEAIAILTLEKNESIEGYKPESLEEEKPEPQEAPPKAAGPQKAKPKEPSEAVSEPKGVSLKMAAFVPEKPLEQETFGRSAAPVRDRVLASPLARKLAKEKNLDLSTVQGSGPNGRIMKRDLEKAQPLGAASFGSQKAPQFQAGEYEEIPLSQIRKIIAQRLQEAKTFIPHFYVSQSINVEPLMEIREQLNKGEIKLTFNDFVIKACALALKEHPHVNTGFNSVRQAIIQFKTIDISVAVSLEQGLVTPIVRYADFKNLGEISAEIRSLAKRAKEGKLQPHEYKGGSFTVSNMGMHGVTDFSAIINPPQAAILAVSGIQNVPVVRNNTVVPGKVMNITLSVDHRVIDGVMAVQFIKTVQKFLENPACLLL